MKLVFNPSPLLARIVADITGDGHLQLSERRGVVSFYSKNLKTISEENKKFFRLFGIRGKVRKYTSGGYVRYGIFYPSKQLCQFLASIGVPVGNKTNNSFLVPEWILNGSSNIKREYLRGLYTGEGSVYPTRGKKRIRWRIELEQYKLIKLKKNGKRFMSQIRDMLQYFGINCSPVRFGKRNKRKDGSITIGIKFDVEKKYFKLFNKKIGFDDKNKTLKLLNGIAGESGSSS